jgi:rhodanese-related sulfurtransferase
MPTDISRDRVQELIAEGAVLFDVRPDREYADEHIAGARHLWLKTIDATSTASLDKALATVVY